MKKKDKTKQKTPAASTTLCVNLCFTHTHTHQHAHTRTHTSKRAETLFNFDQEIPVKKGLKWMNSLWGCTCRALTVKISSNDTLAHWAQSEHILRPCIMCERAHFARNARAKQAIALHEKKENKERKKKERCLSAKAPEVTILRSPPPSPSISWLGLGTVFASV